MLGDIITVLVEGNDGLYKAIGIKTGFLDRKDVHRGPTMQR